MELSKDEQMTKLTLAEGSKLLDNYDVPTTLSSFIKGYTIKAYGDWDNGSFIAKQVKFLEAPNVIVDEPKANQSVSDKILIIGRARVFESVISIKLREKSGKIFLTDTVMAQAEDMGLYGEFIKEITIPSGSNRDLVLEVFQSSAKDGSEIDKVSIPLIYETSSKTLTLKVFFNNSNLDPEASCNKVFAVERTVPYTQQTARVALEELIKGPAEQEKLDKYFTSLPINVKIQKLTIENGIANADFSKDLEQGVGGSCRVSAIRAQITETLKQFPTVNQVVISIDGRTEDILQP